MSADKHDTYGLAESMMGGKEKKPAKEIEHIRTRRAKNSKGGHSYIHEHHYTHPEHYPKEEHVSSDQDAMVSHMMDHLGQPNSGEAEADAGQSGIEGGAMPQPVAA